MIKNLAKLMLLYIMCMHCTIRCHLTLLHHIILSQHIVTSHVHHCHITLLHHTIVILIIFSEGCFSPISEKLTFRKSES